MSMLGCWSYVFGNSLSKAAYSWPAPCFQGQGIESSLCFEEVEVKCTCIFYTVELVQEHICQLKKKGEEREVLLEISFGFNIEYIF